MTLKQGILCFILLPTHGPSLHHLSSLQLFTHPTGRLGHILCLFFSLSLTRVILFCELSIHFPKEIIMFVKEVIMLEVSICCYMIRCYEFGADLFGFFFTLKKVIKLFYLLEIHTCC